MNGVIGKGCFTEFTRGTLLMITLALGSNLFIGEHSALAPGTILLRIIILDSSSVPRLQINVGGSDLWTVFIPVTHLAVDATIRTIIIVQRIQLIGAGGAPETVLMIPLPIGSHHLLSFVNLPFTLWTTVLSILLRLDDPGLDGGPGQHVIFVVVELAQVLGSGSHGLSPGSRS